MRIAGSVAASVAPTRSATEKDSEKTGIATSATTSAVIRIPGSTSSPSPTAVREMTRSEIPSPPWKRISETPSVKTSWAPSPSTGFSTRSVTDGPMRIAGRQEHDHDRQPQDRRDGVETTPARRISPTSRRTSCASTLEPKPFASGNPQKQIPAARIPAFGGAHP